MHHFIFYCWCFPILGNVFLIPLKSKVFAVIADQKPGTRTEGAWRRSIKKCFMNYVFYGNMLKNVRYFKLKQRWNQASQTQNAQLFLSSLCITINWKWISMYCFFTRPAENIFFVTILKIQIQIQKRVKKCCWMCIIILFIDHDEMRWNDTIQNTMPAFALNVNAMENMKTWKLLLPHLVVVRSLSSYSLMCVCRNHAGHRCIREHVRVKWTTMR